MSPGRGAPGRPRVPRAEREAEMLKAAAAVFGERGYHDASMAEIASRVGITKPMLYTYFGSKEGLFAACGEEAATLLAERVRAAAALPDLAPDERLWRGLVSVFSFIGENRDLWFAFVPPPGASTPAGAQEATARGRGALNALMEELVVANAVQQGVGAQAASQAAPLAHALAASVWAVADWWLQHPDEPAELQALRLMNFAWVGFGGILDGDLWLPRD